MQHRHALIVEELVELRHPVDAHTVEQQAAVGGADLDERGPAEVVVRVRAFDVDADRLGGHGAQRWADLGGVVDEHHLAGGGRDRRVGGRGHAAIRTVGDAPTRDATRTAARLPSSGARSPRADAGGGTHVDAGRTLLCVHPHPDDESIACGGVLARASATGARTVVVTCTGGEAGENLAGIDLGDEDLPTHRRREMAAAIAALGVDEHVWLGYRDSGMVGTDDNDHPDSFHRADLDEAAARLAAILRRVRPDVVVSDDVHGTYGHPDHVKAHRVTVRAVGARRRPGCRRPGRRRARWPSATSTR